MTRALISCFFDARMQGPFARMARVLGYSFREQHPSGWTIQIERLTPDGRRASSGVEAHAHNTQKLEHWVRRASALDDGTELLLIDADAMVQRSLDDIWDRPFDLAYTVKADPLPPSAPFPWNLGVMFLRLSPSVRAFLLSWLEANADLFRSSPTEARVWRRTHGGINQAAFGRLRARGALEALHTLELPCAEWNCEESAWTRADQSRARIVHLKGELRRELFQACRPRPEFAALIQTWRTLEAASTSTARTA